MCGGEKEKKKEKRMDDKVGKRGNNMMNKEF